MSNNLQVITSFLNQKQDKTAKRMINGPVYMYEGRTLEARASLAGGYELINYDTILARITCGVLYINIHKYSQTTSKIQSQLIQAAADFFEPSKVIFGDGEPNAPKGEYITPSLAIDTIRDLSTSQGFYGRLLRDIEADLYSKADFSKWIIKKQFKNTLDLILSIEG